MKIPREIKRVIKIMNPDKYEAEYGINFKYCVRLKYNNIKFNTIKKQHLLEIEYICKKICKNSDVVFFIERL